jgi:hypothetical protein
MKSSCKDPLPKRGYTLVEVIISMTITVLVIGLCTGVFLQCLKLMYYDSVRLETNANLRYFIAHISKEALDASEFYIFPSYQSLDGDVSLSADLSPSVLDKYGKTVVHGDCIVLVTRESVEGNARIKNFKIYYRVASVSARNTLAPIRYYDSGDKTATNSFTAAQLKALLDTVNLSATPSVSGSRQLTEKAKGRVTDSTTDGVANSHPIFSSEAATVNSANESFVINTEIVQGTTANKMVSSSSFNYTVTPRR